MSFPEYREPDIPPLSQEEFEAIMELLQGPSRNIVDVNLDDWEDSNGTND